MIGAENENDVFEFTLVLSGWVESERSPIGVMVPVLLSTL